MVATADGEDAVSVAIEDAERNGWSEKVYQPDILGNWDNLFKKPGYDPFPNYEMTCAFDREDASAWF